MDSTRILTYREPHRGGVWAEKMLLFSVVGVWLVGTMAALICFSTFRSDTQAVTMYVCERMSLGFAIGSVLTIGTCRLLAGKLWSRQLCVVLSLLTALIYVGISINMAGWLSPEGCHWTNPGLAPWTDAKVAWDNALMWERGEPLKPWFGSGYPLFLGSFISIFGKNLLAPLLFNAACMVISCLLAGVVSANLVKQGSPKTNMWFGALLMALIPSIPFYGSVIMKEAPLTLSFSFAAVALSDLYTGKMRVWPLVCTAITAVILILLKHQIAYIIGFGAVICLARIYLCRPQSKRRSVNQAIALLLLCTAVLISGRKYKIYSDFLLLDRTEAVDNYDNMLHQEAVGRYSKLVADYYERSVLGKLEYLPLTASAQYFPPFPWNFNRDKELGAFVPYAHLSGLWYAVGGLILAYFVLCLYSRRKGGGLRLWALYFAAVWAGIAMMSAGTVARYWLPFIVLGIPLAIHALRSVRSGLVSHRAFTVYGVTYILLLTSALIVSYNFLEHS